nr:hypothetical protein [Bacteroidales bacterium]
MDPNKYYRLFAPCIPVRGFRRSVIADLNRHQLFYIPNKLYQILVQEKNRTWSDLMEKYGYDNLEALTSYFGFLLQNELVFPFNKEELAHFPKLLLQWDFPSYCSNAVLDIGHPSNYDVPKAITLLDEISCFHLQIRLLREVSPTYLDQLLELTNDTSIRTVQLMMNYCQPVDEQLDT